ncbi:MAG: hypothetical protein V1722_02695 [Candidatus Micrarchaeota archaeon]
MVNKILISTIAALVAFALLSTFNFSSITGQLINELNPMPGQGTPGGPSGSGPQQYGPSAGDIQCMVTCMKCTSPGVGCSGNSTQCQAQCNVVKPEQTQEEQCVETCAKVGCGEFDFVCQQGNQAKCDKQCGMIKAPDESTMNEEQKCITRCVNSQAPGTICGASQTGETGGEVCQMCANQCKHLYSGPCLDEAKLTAKKAECNTCPTCYGEPVNGPSGEGWDCIVDVMCKDSTGQFGDTPGTGEGITQNTSSNEEQRSALNIQIVPEVSRAIENVANSVVSFLKGIFG